MAKPKSFKCTIKMERFAQEYVRNGGNGMLAYRHAYDTSTSNDQTVRNNASALLKYPTVAERVDEIRAEHALAEKATTQWRIQTLIKSTESALRDKRYTAVRDNVNELNRMLGGHKQTDLNNLVLSIETKAEIPSNGRERTTI